jgi:cystathionine beta-lyase family protein involved in aluminum resistance
MTDKMYRSLGICDDVINYVSTIEQSLETRFKEIDCIAEINQLKVLKAMQDNRVSDVHFAATTGYGYNDLGRDTLEDVYASVFNAEAALVRPQLISGTHALNIALSSHLRPGDELLSPVGKPYDTLEEVIGIRETPGSLKEFGITYAQVDFLDGGKVDYDGIRKAINDRTKLITIQRSKGYDWRPTLSSEEIGEISGEL